jgi:hypothetical protein
MPVKAARAAGHGAPKTQTWTASVLTGIELTSAHIGASLRAAREVSGCST